jgi:hypothetical protein
LLLRNLVLLRLRRNRMLLRSLALLRLWCRWTLLLGLRTLLLRRRHLLRLLLRLSLIVHLHRWRRFYIAICRKRLTYSQIGRAAMVDAGKLRTVCAGGTFILHLSPHGRGVGLVPGRQFRGPGPHLQSSRTAVEAHPRSAAVVLAD